MSNNTYKKKPSQPSSPLINLMQLHPVLPTKFPTLSELIGSVAQEEVVKPRARLFNSLIGDPRVLLQDLLETPQKYETGVSELIQLLIAGSKKHSELSETELDLLDRAVLDFNRSLPPEKPQPPQTQGLRAYTNILTTEEDAPAELEQHSLELAEELPPYWWA